ncbi:hypothetical protein NGRA_1753 [Nosema granulosis]|uniref:Uncharacterized protein n=1 Tax=Nosema granulosis TaxID=83296 RepID=A0A9P6KYT3_9MICR|nr:hypothetical protein NGRA_1753 [Nosema granulosis]
MKIKIFLLQFYVSLSLCSQKKEGFLRNLLLFRSNLNDRIMNLDSEPTRFKRFPRKVSIYDQPIIKDDTWKRVDDVFCEFVACILFGAIYVPLYLSMNLYARFLRFIISIGHKILDQEI